MHEDEKKLADVHPDETFKTSQGKEIKNLKQLLHVLNEISPESFSHHVNDGKNDFAKWIKNSVKDDELAEIIEKTTDFDKTRQIINDRIELLEKKIEVKKIKDSLESLRAETIGIDKPDVEIQNPSTIEDNNIKDSGINDSTEIGNGAPLENPKDNSDLNSIQNNESPSESSTPNNLETSSNNQMSLVNDNSGINNENNNLASSNLNEDNSGSTNNQEMNQSKGMDFHSYNTHHNVSNQHPFEHLKKGLHMTIRDILIGVVIGLIIGYFIGRLLI